MYVLFTTNKILVSPTPTPENHAGHKAERARFYQRSDATSIATLLLTLLFRRKLTGTGLEPRRECLNYDSRVNRIQLGSFPASPTVTGSFYHQILPSAITLTSNRS
jgi:hypothetical protein